MSQLRTHLRFHPEPDDPAARCAAENRPPVLEISVPTGSAHDGPHERRDTPAPSAGEITPPWAPIVRLPALDHVLIVMGRHVEMHEVYSSVCSFRGDGALPRRRPPQPISSKHSLMNWATRVECHIRTPPSMPALSPRYRCHTGGRSGRSRDAAGDARRRDRCFWIPLLLSIMKICCESGMWTPKACAMKMAANA